MATFIGFSTLHAENIKTLGYPKGVVDVVSTTAKTARFGKKFRTTDEELVVRDFINALNIPQGQKPGKPEYGTTLWSFVFEPNTVDVRAQLEEEIKRIASEDPRLILNTVSTTNLEGGIMIELEVAVSPFNNATELAILFDQTTNTAYGV